MKTLTPKPERGVGILGAELHLQFGPGIAVTHPYGDARLRTERAVR